MGDVVTRKCACCKGTIVIDIDDIDDVVYFDKLYYHKACFRELVSKKATNKRCSPKWKAVLDMGLKQPEDDAKYIINYCYGRNKLFDHILRHYDIYAISSYAKMLMENVVSGEYKGKSKPIMYRDFADCWIDMQPDLDSIYKNNQRLGKNMTDDQRINYDLAVVVRTYPEWKRKIEHEKKNAKNRNVPEQCKINIDYSQIKTQTHHDGLDDISDLLDEI